MNVRMGTIYHRARAWMAASRENGNVRSWCAVCVVADRAIYILRIKTPESQIISPTETVVALKLAINQSYL